VATAALVVAPCRAGAAEGDEKALRSLSLGRFVDATSLEQLADMVVTDTKVAQSPDSVTQHIVVLRAEDIARQPEVNRNLAELLRYTSGQFVNVLSRNDANWGSYAGLGPKYNSYLLDGLPIDSFADAMSLDASMIERVEVHKGPASVLYSNYLTMDFAGNEAPLAGTTNFVLKRRVDAPLTRLSLGMGSWGTYTGRAYVQDRKGPLSFILGTTSEHSDYTQFGQRDSWLQTVNSPDYRKTRLFGNLNYELGGDPRHTVALFVHHTDHRGDIGRPNRDFSHSYDTANLTYNNQFAAAWHIQFKAGERRYDRDFGNDAYPASLASTGHGNTRQVIRPMDLTVSYLHGANGLLTMGMDHQSVQYRTTNRSPEGVTSGDNDVRARSTGYFLQEKVQWRDWVFRAGVRHNTIVHDYALLGGNAPAANSASWSKSLWSFGVRYNLAQHFDFYGNVGSSFMAPAANQIGGTSGGHLPNPGLTPESGIGRDLGFDWRPTRTLTVGLRGFLNTISSAIVDNVVSVTPSQTRSENAGQARSAGVELDVRVAPSEGFVWFANLTNTRTRVQHPTNADEDGSAIPFAPDTVANLGLSMQLPGRLTVSPYYHWVGRYYDSTSRSGRQSFGHYGILNMRVQYPWRKGVDLVLDLNNIGNQRYDMPWGFRDPGFSGFAGLSFTF
jgi:outer membrane receptor protein involved in Fe transport